MGTVGWPGKLGAGLDWRVRRLHRSQVSSQRDLDGQQDVSDPQVSALVSKADPDRY